MSCVRSDCLKLALAQAEPGPDPLSKAVELSHKAASLGADIILFPEMWSTGYCLSGTPVPLDGEYVRTLKQTASTLGIAICGTMLEKAGNGLRNTAILIDRSGKQRLAYSKVHTCDFADEKILTPGDAFHTAVLDTAKGEVKIGVMICFDREFPESARILMLQGAELILVPNACEMEINRLSQLRSRAYENMLAIATCNYPEEHDGCNGRSSFFDGIAYDESGSRDMCTLLANESEGIFMASLDLKSLRAYRKSEVHGNAYRHPDKYSPIVQKGIEEPFIRSDYRP